ncbi:MAG TPA: CBS domain-containing protein, partial [Steroidobacteraceae bacterium]|nr:CBS domain-containing protein [Steroidobacteraceae bacterium]
MLVQTILQRKGSEVFTVGLEATVEEAARVMNERNVGALVVMLGDAVAGILSHREIVAGVAKHRRQLLALRVRELMRRDIVGVSPHEEVKTVMVLMTRHRTTHVPVFASDRLAGIVSIGDVIKHRLEELELEANVLRDAYITTRG